MRIKYQINTVFNNLESWLEGRVGLVVWGCWGLRGWREWGIKKRSTKEQRSLEKSLLGNGRERLGRPGRARD